MAPLASSLGLAIAFLLDVSPKRVVRLDDAIAVALRQHPSIKQANAATNAATARIDEAKSTLFPQLTAVASYQRVRRANFAGTAAITGTTTGGPPSALAPVTSPSGIDVFTFGVSATQLIWDFGRTTDNYRAADRLASAAGAEEKVTEQTVIVGVRRAYFTARAQSALVIVARDSLVNFERHLTQIIGFVQTGTRPEIDLAQARNDVANARVSLIDAQNAYELAKTILAQAMGDPSTPAFEVADDELPPIDGEDLPPAALYTRAIKQRPELVSLERQRESRALTLGSVRGGYWPTLAASGGASETGTALSNLGPAWNVGANLTWQFFQGGLTRAQVREAEANLAAAEAALETQRQQIRVDVQQAAQNLRSAKASQTAADDALVNARERLRLAEGRYAAGLGDVIELGDAQLALATAQSQVVQARFRLASARADLVAAIGARK
jgi:outer membrane protein